MTFTIEYINSPSSVTVDGIAIVDRTFDVYKESVIFFSEYGQMFKFSNVEVMEGGAEYIIDSIRSRLRIVREAMSVQVEMIQDEDPEELDPHPVFICDDCKKEYG